MKGLILNDVISVPSQREITDAGQMIVPCAFARTGVQLYKGASIGLIDRADEIIEVHRTEEVVFDEDSMKSFRSAPVTIGHPKDDKGSPVQVTADNAKDYQVGMLEGMPTRDEDTLTGTLVIASKEAIDQIEEGIVELSAGYTCDIAEVDGKYYQKNIKANHIAIVEKGRAGSGCAIADEDDVGKNDDKPDSEFDAKQLEMGIAHEKEHTDSEEVAKSIAKDHLVEDPEYYTKLQKIEDEVTEEPTRKEDIKDVDPAEMKAMQTVDANPELVTDLSEAEAAEAVAQYEEAESDMDNFEAEMAKQYAEDAEAWAKAHAEVAKAARKIANKKAKSMADEAEKGGGLNLEDDVNTIIVALDVADETIKKLEAKLADAEETLDKEVTARSDVIVLAKDMTDLDDFAGKTVHEIKKMVVTDRLDIDLSDKSEAYIEARFEILCEDSEKETPMGKLLKNNVITDAPAPYVDPVSVARKNMIERNLNKENK